MKALNVIGPVALCALWTFFENNANAEEDQYRPGDTVVIDTCTDTKIGSNAVGRVHRGKTYDVLQTQGEWLWIDNNGQKGWVSTRHVQPSSWVTDNVRHSVNRGVNTALQITSENLYRVKRGYDAVRATGEYFKSGTPGNPSKALEALVAVDSAFSGPIAQAGVGPQAAFITKFADTVIKSTMEQQDSGTAALKHGLAQQQLHLFHVTGDPKYLMKARDIARPDPTYGQLNSWNGREPLRISSHPAAPAQSYSTTVDNLTTGWDTTVHKEPFRTNATNPIGRTVDRMNWALNQNNITTTQRFNHNIQSPHGTAHVESLRIQTGYGYQPGETKRHESSRVSIPGPVTHEWGGGTKPYDRVYSGHPHTQHRSQHSFSQPSSNTPSFSTPNFSSPSSPFRR